MRFFKATAAAMIMMHGQHVWATDDNRIESAELTFEEFEKIHRNKPHGKNEHYRRECAKACYETKACRHDPHSHSSYCKKEHNHPATCFGLYHKERHPHEAEDKSLDEYHREKFCFRPNDKHCKVRIILRNFFMFLFRESVLSFVIVMMNTMTKYFPSPRLMISQKYPSSMLMISNQEYISNVMMCGISSEFVYTLRKNSKKNIFFRSNMRSLVLLLSLFSVTICRDTHNASIAKPNGRYIGNALMTTMTIDFTKFDFSISLKGLVNHSVSRVGYSMNGESVKPDLKSVSYHKFISDFRIPSFKADSVRLIYHRNGDMIEATMNGLKFQARKAA